jgi:hypothetical protein
MIRKISLTGLFFLAFGLASAADWKSELLSCLGPRPDYLKALNLLAEQVKGMEAGDRQTADALLPYLARKLGRTAEEQDLISDYYEKYKDNDPEFGFLDDPAHRDFLDFWMRWKSSYPLVSNMSFLLRPEGAASTLPAGIEIGLDLLNNAYYKISLGPYALEGGFWPRGFHIVTVPVEGLFDRSGTYEFSLDLKSGALVLRKPIRIEVNVSSVARLGSLPPAFPAVEDGNKPRPAPPVQSNLEGDLSLYVGGKLIMTSRKLAVRMPPINIPIPGPSMRGTKPYLPPPKTDPMANSVSILDALALTYMTLKDLLSKKPPAPSAPSYQKVTSLSFSFDRAAGDGPVSGARADVRLDPLRGVILRR